MSGDHGFSPHCTLTYQTKGTPRPKRATPLPEIVFTPESLVCKIGSERHVFQPGDTACPECGQEDCCCIEMSDVTKSFRAYRGRKT
jgi:hypothetical protein